MNKNFKREGKLVREGYTIVEEMLSGVVVEFGYMIPENLYPEDIRNLDFGEEITLDEEEYEESDTREVLFISQYENEFGPYVWVSIDLDQEGLKGLTEEGKIKLIYGFKGRLEQIINEGSPI